jgi:hypothetical protein
MGLVRRSRLLLGLLLLAATGAVASTQSQSQVTPALPARAAAPADRLSDAEFWRLLTSLSEPDGTFHSENLVSNETRFQAVVPSLAQAVPAGRAYLGVGSEQNFTYLAAVRPSIAFIVDIRRGNLALHLAYKALFELSTDRVDFVSRVFSRARPAGLSATAPIAQIVAAYRDLPADEALYASSLAAIYRQLTVVHGFTLSAGDRQGLEYALRAWFTDGINIRYSLTGRTGRGGGGGFPTYGDLMAATDDEGRQRSYLASAEAFATVQDLHRRNLIIPIVGNFGGATALRGVGETLRARGATLGMLYASNVEQYLLRDGLWDTFCRSVSTLPTDARSVIVRSSRGGLPTVPGAAAAGGGFAQALFPVSHTTALCPAS